MNYDEGSFRDPAGKVFYHLNKVYRQINISGQVRIKFLEEKNLIRKAQENNFLVNSKILNPDEVQHLGFDKDSLIIEHEKIPYISYPYEWSFSQLKSAALHHLDFHLFLLENNATLIDASAYNIQFIGANPKFIDILSIKEYEDGEYWYGHKPFCENFLNPLILSAKKGIQFNKWFKGNLEGIPTDELNNILTFFDKFSYNIFVHVYLLNKFDNKYKNQNKKVNINLKKKFPKKNLVSMLTQLRNFIKGLKQKKIKTVWENYSTVNTYKKSEENEKAEIVKNFIDGNILPRVIDLGCNDGFYSKIAMRNNINYVVGFDYDSISIDRAFNSFGDKQKNFLPLIFDATNPSANIGWNELERKSFNKRANFDGLLALAFEHHLAIAKNIPLKDTVNWLVSLAPKGLIEFVPKNDETVQKMLKFKGDIFPDYSEDNFKKYIEEEARIISIKEVTSSGRKIYQYEK
jgi:ribosomal protein L11 methylase PrmA